MDPAHLHGRDRTALAAPWLPVLVAVPAFLLLPGLVAVATVFAGWAAALAVLSLAVDAPGVPLRAGAAAAALVACAVLALGLVR